MNNVPDSVYIELSRRAGLRNLSVSDYVMKLIERDQRRPLLEEWLAEVRTHEQVPFEIGKSESARDDLEGQYEGSNGRSRR